MRLLPVFLLAATPLWAAGTAQEQDARAIEALSRSEVPGMSDGRWPWSPKKPTGWSTVTLFELDGCLVTQRRMTKGPPFPIDLDSALTFDLARTTIPDPAGPENGLYPPLPHLEVGAEIILTLAEGFEATPTGGGAHLLGQPQPQGFVIHEILDAKDITPVLALAQALIDYKAKWCSPSS
ncbi:hypothetical protein [Sagittula sp. SSi028]|uniref:hypothetical protein n=1 Tax=Sagittula sp. SSi028 TaxID=3400636 RepID=UPI003AF7E5B0